MTEPAEPEPPACLAAEDGIQLDALVGYNLKRAYMVVQDDFRRTLGADGLTPRAFSVLVLAVQRPDITQSDVARALGIERSGLVAIVDELEDKALIRRAPVPGDRRIQALRATKKGCSTFKTVSRAVVAHEERLLSALTRSERNSLLTILQKIRDQGEKKV